MSVESSLDSLAKASSLFSSSMVISSVKPRMFW